MHTIVGFQPSHGQLAFWLQALGANQAFPARQLAEGFAVETRNNRPLLFLLGVTCSVPFLACYDFEAHHVRLGVYHHTALHQHEHRLRDESAVVWFRFPHTVAVEAVTIKANGIYFFPQAAGKYVASGYGQAEFWQYLLLISNDSLLNVEVHIDDVQLSTTLADLTAARHWSLDVTESTEGRFLLNSVPLIPCSAHALDAP